MNQTQKANAIIIGALYELRQGGLDHDNLIFRVDDPNSRNYHYLIIQSNGNFYYFSNETYYGGIISKLPYGNLLSEGVIQNIFNPSYSENIKLDDMGGIIEPMNGRCYLEADIDNDPVSVWAKFVRDYKSNHNQFGSNFYENSVDYDMAEFRAVSYPQYLEDLEKKRAEKLRNTEASRTANAVQQSTVTINLPTQGNKEMNPKINSIIGRAKNQALTAAQMQAGKALNIALVKFVTPKLPFMVRGYMDHPAAPALVALAIMSASEFLPASAKGAKIQKAADLMLAAAIYDGADQLLDLERIIDQVFKGLPAEALAALESPVE